MKARVLYDFDGNQEGEIDLREGQTITVTDTQVGDGWFEGTVEGKSGLFPEAYVQLLSAEEADDDNEYFQQQQIGNGMGAFDDDEDYDDIEGSHDQLHHQSIHSLNHNNQSNAGSSMTIGGDTISDNSEEGANGSNSNNAADTPPLNGPAAAKMGIDRRPSQQNIKTNWNRFSFFVKSGTEDFLLDKNKPVEIPQEQILKINSDYEWVENPTQFTVKVSAPTKKSKLMGMKSFIVYVVTPSHTDVPVNRRYKHFDWLYNRLTSKFPLICIPPLPQSAAGGKFEVNLVKKRTAKLERWLNRVARHPVISQSIVFQHFLTCDDGKVEWKSGKRRAEADPITGANFFKSVEFVDDQDVTPHQIEEIEAFATHLKEMDKKRAQLISVFQHFVGAHSTFKREYNNLAEAFNHQLAKDEEFELKHPMEPKVGDWCWKKQCDECRPLGKAFKSTCRTYRDIAETFGEQPKADALPFLSAVKEYSGIINTYKGVLSIHQSSRNKAYKNEKLADHDKVDPEKVASLKGRVDRVTKITLAEINRVHKVRQADYKQMMQEFLKSQVQFHRSIADKLESALLTYNY
eukprot:Nk52_evm14s267 gene=Nk52_evmTU14s267